MKYELRNLLSVLSWIILVAGLYLSVCTSEVRYFWTYAKPVDFLIPAIIVDRATRSNARRDNLLRPNIVVLRCGRYGWPDDKSNVFLVRC